MLSILAWARRAHLVQQDIIRATEGPTALLKYLANGVDL